MAENLMTTDLFYLALTAVLTACLWLPYAVGLGIARGGKLPVSEYTTMDRGPVADWVKRCNRAHMNSVEAFAPFAALVIVAHLTQTSNDATALASLLFFWGRVGHAVVQVLGIPYVRTLMFAIGFFSTLAIFVQIIA